MGLPHTRVATTKRNGRAIQRYARNENIIQLKGRYDERLCSTAIHIRFHLIVMLLHAARPPVTTHVVRCSIYPYDVVGAIAVEFSLWPSSQWTAAATHAAALRYGRMRYVDARDANTAREIYADAVRRATAALGRVASYVGPDPIMGGPTLSRWRIAPDSRTSNSRMLGALAATRQHTRERVLRRVITLTWEFCLIPLEPPLARMITALRDAKRADADLYCAEIFLRAKLICRGVCPVDARFWLHASLYVV